MTKLSLALIAGLSLSLAACGGKKDAEKSIEAASETAKSATEDATKKAEEMSEAMTKPDLRTDNQKWMDENGTKEGVMTTESGLQYKVLESGDGAMPTLSSVVKVHYEGRLINGDVFDSSIARGTPIEYDITGFVKGWTEGLQLMKVGDTFELYVPPNLGYGPRGKGAVPPNSIMIFKMQLLGTT